VVELHPQRAAVTDGDREVEPFVLDPEVVEVAQRLPREVPQLGVVALALELADDDDGDDDSMFRETEDGLRIGEEDGRVEHIRALFRLRRSRCLAVRPGCCLSGC